VRVPLAGDASTRRYERLFHGRRPETLILMDQAAGRGERLSAEDAWTPNGVGPGL
jgi:hypothetical protein